MYNLKLHKKSNPCPVCGGHKGCKTDLSTDRVLCRGVATSTDYQLLKTSGQWGIYVHQSQFVDYNSLSDREKEQHNEAIRQRRLEAEREHKLRREAQLTSEDYALQLKQLVWELPLKQPHRTQLIKYRGFRKNEIKGKFASITKGHKCKQGYNLPGFVDGTYVGASGMLCFISDAQDRLLGAQVQSDDPSLGKYLWTSHEKDGVLIQARLQEYDEYPMNVCKPKKVNSPFVGVCEGMIKPAIASQKYGMPFIGYAGGQFSPKYLLAQLEILNPDKSQSVVIFPDAGTLSNEGWVFQLNMQYIELLQNNGYDVKVADWGQWFSKDIGDIDEIVFDGLNHFIINRPVDYFVKCRSSSVLYGTNRDGALDTVLYSRVIPDFLEKLLTVHKISDQDERQKLKAIDYGVFESWSDNIQKGRQYEFEIDHAKAYRQLLDREDIGVILDNSATGTGKTHGVANLELREKEKLFALVTSPNNPNHIKLETDHKRLTVRNAGLIEDAEKCTLSGKPVLVTCPPNETPDTIGNCHWAGKFHALYAVGSHANPCTVCTFNTMCKTGSGDGFGYKYLMGQALKNQRIIANPQGITQNMVTNKSIAVVDECGQSVQWTTLKKVDATDFHDLSRLYITEPDLHSNIQDFAVFLAHFMEKEGVGYGSSTARIIEKLAKYVPVIFGDLSELREKLTNFNDEYNKEFIKANRSLNDSDRLQSVLATNWFVDFLDILTGDNPYSALRIVDNKIHILTRNNRTIDALNSFSKIIYQDATCTREELALRLGIDPSEITVIRKKQNTPTDNVIIHHVTGLGRLGNNRAPSSQQKVNELRKVFNDIYRQPNVGYIDYKKFAQAWDLNHHSTGRGSNAFQHKKAIVSFGIPCSNLSATQMEYETFTGERCKDLEEEGLQEYINRKIVVEFVQEFGRLRANRRENETLHHYLVGDVNVNFFRQMGYNVVTESAFSLTRKAGNSQQRARWNIFLALKNLIASGKKYSEVTQDELAAQAGVWQSTISRMAKQFKGWEGLKRVLTALLCQSKAIFTAEFGEITEDDIFLANHYLPDIFKLDMEEFAVEMQQFIETYGIEKLEQLIELTPIDVIVDWLRRLLEFMPYHYKKRFRAICQGSG